MIGARPSFLWAHLSSIRSVTHGWIGTGVRKPMDNRFAHPVSAGSTAAASSQSLRRIQARLPPPCGPDRPSLLDVSVTGVGEFNTESGFGDRGSGFGKTGLAELLPSPLRAGTGLPRYPIPDTRYPNGLPLPHLH